MPEEMRKNLRYFFTDVIPLPPDGDLAEPVRCHPDMIFAVLDGRLYVSARYFCENADVIGRIAEYGAFEIHPYDGLRNEVYPHDTAFNIAVRGDSVICRPDSTAPSLLDFAAVQGYRIVPVKQGYTGCSCVVTEDAVLTSDRGIAESLARAGIPCILLPSPDGSISLPGYACGFWGGACGYHDGVIFFCGNADTLPCADDIRRLGYRMVSLSGTPVTDYGGIRIFEKKAKLWR